MQIKDIIYKIWCYFNNQHKNIRKDNLDAKYWIQNILLKNHIKSSNKSN